MPLPPEWGGMISPEQHPNPHVSLEDYRRGLNAMIDICTRNDTADDELAVIENVASLVHVGMDDNHVRHLLGWALVRLAKISIADAAYEEALKNRVHGSIAANRYLTAVQEAIQP
jgi:hypothetical protein